MHGVSVNYNYELRTAESHVFEIDCREIEKYSVSDVWIMASVRHWLDSYILEWGTLELHCVKGIHRYTLRYRHRIPSVSYWRNFSTSSQQILKHSISKKRSRDLLTANLVSHFSWKQPVASVPNGLRTRNCKYN